MAVKHSHYGPSTVYDVSQPTRLSVPLSACLSLCLPVCLSSCWLFPAAVQAIVLFRLRSPLSLLMLWQDVRVLQKSSEENKIFSILPVLCPLDFHSKWIRNKKRRKETCGVTVRGRDRNPDVSQSKQVKH